MYDFTLTPSVFIQEEELLCLLELSECHDIWMLEDFEDLIDIEQS